MSEIKISPLEIPRALAADGSDDFTAANTLRNQTDETVQAYPELAYDPVVEIAIWQPSTFEERRMLVARDKGRIVGRGDYATQVGDEADTAWINAYVHPDYRRRGIGSRLLTELEKVAADAGKRKVHVYVSSLPSEGALLAAPTGFGAVPRDAAGTQFLGTHRYSFEQVERVSRLPLPVPGLHSLVDDAIKRCSRDYAVHEWAGPCPEKWRDDLALLYTRMSTDEPSAGLEPPEDVWTAERVNEQDQRLLEGTATAVYAAIEHIASGELVAYTSLMVPQQLELAVLQDNTIVLGEHRGHRLGNLLKVLNLAHLERVAPGHPSVITYNAEENRPMLSVNEAVGFVPIGYEGAWKKELR
ncbi:acetyltransferase (GNAT) family protein [Salinibacterium amurskyense]|uniref:Acetyltransferase (GNAT) family protein n=1 Tax=Salinibacterium amurskyense TaxID=205941 RepID=A0A2M9D8B3_9MICO|nr:GNAT family N-acetyltransferase [Salinibacterium amurskyense]PJJ81941.1 acetyltransferase (GNAT) family protein [Salinibacterium amurskyense]RLQ81732.1 N-acetyltransferase [Salinibacterium amurskyense]GHD78743.1 GNAT family N-acetyltransferase [Salinibacterium amurskyense]